MNARQLRRYARAARRYPPEQRPALSAEEVARAFVVPPWISGTGPRPSWRHRPIYRLGWWWRVWRYERRFW